MEVKKNHLLSQTKTSFKISPYFQTKLCYVGQKEVFAEGSTDIEEFLGVKISAKQIENVSHYWGEEYGKLMDSENFEKTKRSKGLHYVMMDGAMILSREPSWKEVKLGRIFKADDAYVLGNEENARGWIRQSNYTAHLGNCHDFFDKMSPKVDLLEEFIGIADGAKWIWEWFDQHYPTAPQILDYWHGVEHLWKFAKLVFKTGEEQKRWIEQQEKLLWEDNIEQVILEISDLVVTKKSVIQEKESLLTYLKNNKARMKYGTFKNKGWLVGSGAIESAHRTVIQKRMKLSGQRWTLNGAQQILNLRVAHKNENWTQVVQLIAA